MGDTKVQVGPRLPRFNMKEKTFEQYRIELDLWLLITNVEKKKQAIEVILSLPESSQDEYKIKELCLSKLTKEELASDSGITKLLEFMDSHFKKDDIGMLWDKYVKFDELQRKHESISEYISEFDIKYNELSKLKVELPQEILAFMLLRKANIVKDEIKLIMTGLDYAKKETLYDQAKKSLRKFKGDHASGIVCEAGPDGAHSSPDITVKQEVFASDVYATRGSYGNYPSRGRGVTPQRSGGYQYNRRRNGGFRNKYGANNNQNNVDSSGKRVNPKGRDGEYMRCHGCGSYRHLISECGDVLESNVSVKESSKEDVIVLYTGNIASYVSNLSVEAANCVVLDSACSFTVCGQKWLDYYLASLSEAKRNEVKIESSDREFRFGGGERLMSSGLYSLPATLAGKQVVIEADVVSSDIPLLLSLQGMKRAGIQLQTATDTAVVLGQTVNLSFTSCGHYCLPLIEEELVDVKTVEEVLRVSIPEGEKKRMLLKLHRQFAHPSNQKLIELLKNAKCWEKDYACLLEEISKKCDICTRFKKTPSRPIVCLPMAKRFNQIVAMDLKKWGNNWICYFVDLFSRLTIAKRISRKYPYEVVQAFMSAWLATGYGTPEEILIDNGGEFTADEIKEMTSVLNVKVNTTAANSPFSNGVCERNHAVMDTMLLKLQAENPKTPLDDLISWACTVKNSMSMFAGFSPYQIVFGKNPTLPGLNEYHPPSTNELDEIKGDVLLKHLQALNSARKAFVEAEASERVRRAMRHKIRISERSYRPGDMVYYKKEGCVEWLGPAKVIFQDGKLVFIRHGSSYIRMSLNRVVLHGEEYGQADIDGQTPKFKSDVGDDDQIVKCHTGENESEISPGENDSVSQSGEKENVSHPGENHEMLLVPAESDESDTVQTDEPLLNSTTLETNESVSWKEIRINDDVQFRQCESDPWTTGRVVSRGGKSTGKYASWFNVETDSDRKSVDFSVMHFRKVPPTVTQTESDTCEPVTCDRVCNTQNLCSSSANDCDRVNSRNIDVICDENSQGNTVHTVSVEKNEIVYKSNVCQKTMEAQLEEIQKLKDFNTYEVVEDVGQKRVSTRWVITEKSSGEKRARLVARGFEEETSIQSDSPTVTKTVIKLFMALCVSFQWIIKSTDIKSAFLQGKDMDRELYVQPPAGFETPGKLWKLRKCLYGLNDAARKFYMSVKESLLNLGCHMSNLEPAIFVYKLHGKVHGLIVCHVDDFLHAGTEMFEKNVIQKLVDTFQASRQESSNFVYVGMNVQQKNGQVVLSQEKYIESIETVTVQAARAKQKGSELNSEEYTLFRSVVGKINWMVQGTRPDCNFDMIELSTKFHSAHICHLLESVKVLRKLKTEPVEILYSYLGPIESWYILVFTDASLANLNGVNSCGGHIVFLVGKEQKCCPIAWHSGKLKRVARSTLSAETMALVSGLEEAMYIRELISMCVQVQLKIRAVVDNRSLVESLGSTSLVDDKRLRIDISAIKEIIETDNVTVSWLPGHGQLANCLTKKGASCKDLLEVLSTGKLPENFV